MSPFPSTPERGRPRLSGEENRPLMAREEVFVAAYFRHYFNATAAAREVTTNDHAASEYAKRVMKRPAVLARIQEIVAKQQPTNKQVNLSLVRLQQEIEKIITDGNKFERVKAIELAAKILGYFAPSRAHVQHSSAGATSFQDLRDTLREHAARMQPDERTKLLVHVETEIAAANECLQLLTRVQPMPAAETPHGPQH